MNRKFPTLLLVSLAGVLLAVALTPLIGRTSAIAAPVGFFELFGSPELGNLVWGFAVVGLLGAGIAVFLASLVALRIARTPSWATLVAFVAGVLVGGYIVVPLLFGQSQFMLAASFGRAWWTYGPELAIVLSALAAAFLHSRLSGRGGGL